MNSDYGLVEEQLQYIVQNEGVFGEEEVGEDGEPAIQTHVNEDGTTSSYFDKRKLKIAPRSTLQFKVGPPFEYVGTYFQVAESYTGRILDLSISPRIDRGFDFIDGEWVGYKRNYFTLVSSFEVPGWDLDEFLGSSFELHGDEGQICGIKYFAIDIKAKSDDDHTEISLVQHTAKRDKGPQFTPAMTPLIPSSLPNHQIIREASNVRNTTKMKKYDGTFYFHRDDPINAATYPGECLVNSYPSDCIQKVARYERVQFASSINVKKPTQQNRHFRLHVVLGAIIPKCFDHYQYRTDRVHEDISKSDLELDPQRDLFIPLQEMRTPPLIIRGRSPSNYTSSQRIAVRTSSYNGSCKREPSMSMSPSNANLASQNSAISQTPMTVSPNKPRPGRPSKRKSRVLNAASPLGSPVPPQQQTLDILTMGNLDTEPTFDSRPVGVPRDTKRVETLEHIETIFQNEGPLALRNLNNFNINVPIEYEPYKPPSLSRQNSVDPKEIELKREKETTQEENLQTVGPLQLLATLKSQNPHKGKPIVNGSNSTSNTSRKKRRINGTSNTTCLELSLEDTKELFNENALEVDSNYRQPESPVSPLSPQNVQLDQAEEVSLGEEFNSISFSLLADSSSNYGLVPNSTLSEMDAVPRIFNSGSIGAQDPYNNNTDFGINFRQHQQPPADEAFLSKEACDAMSGLPSQMVDTGELCEELSFYKHE